MTLGTSSRIGPFEIVGQIGAGGMGEVEPLCGRERSGSPQAKSRGEPRDREPLCGREPFDCAQDKLRGSPQAKSRAGAQRRPERADGEPRAL